MTLSQRVPGMREGSTVWNIGIGFVWFSIFIMVMGACVGAGDDVDDENGEVEADGDGDELDDAGDDADESEDDDGNDTEPEEDDADDDAGGTDSDSGDTGETDEPSESYTAADYEASASQVYEEQTGGTWIDYDESGIIDVSTNAHGDPNVMAGEMGSIGGTYGYYVTQPGNDAPDRMTVYVYGDDAGTQLNGHYYIEAEWAEAYAEGEMTGDEFADNIFGTIETYD